MTIADFSKQLKLTHKKNIYENYIKEALDLSGSYESFLEKLLQAQLENRQNNLIEISVRAYKLPSKITFYDYLTSHLDSKLQKQVIELKNLFSNSTGNGSLFNR